MTSCEGSPAKVHCRWDSVGLQKLDDWHVPTCETSTCHGWTLSGVGAGVAIALKEKGHTVAVSETTTGGLLAASLLSQPGASAYFNGGVMAYSQSALEGLMPSVTARLKGLEEAHGGNYSCPENYYLSRVEWAVEAALCIKSTCKTDWAVAETGAAGPSFHPATGDLKCDVPMNGFSVIAVCGPKDTLTDVTVVGGTLVGGTSRLKDGHEYPVWVRLCETGHAVRQENMWQFAAAAANMLECCIKNQIGAPDNYNITL